MSEELEQKHELPETDCDQMIADLKEKLKDPAYRAATLSITDNKKVTKLLEGGKKVNILGHQMVEADLQTQALAYQVKEEYKKAYKSKLRDPEHLKTLPEETRATILYNQEVEAKKKAEKEADDGRRKPKHALVTVNFLPGLDIPDIIGALKCWSDYKPVIRFTQWVANFEWRWKEEDKPKGLHMHFVVERGDTTPTKMIDTFKRAFKDVCKVPEVVNERSKCMNVKYCADQDGFLNYLKGQKKTEKGRIWAKLDYVERESRDLPQQVAGGEVEDLYERENAPPARPPTPPGLRPVSNLTALPALGSL